MTITMENFALTWTVPDGAPRASAVAYDKTSAERRRQELQAAGCTGVEIVPVRSGTPPEPRNHRVAQMG